MPECTVLVFLDLSAAFDTINHNVLLNRVQYLYGIIGTAFKWFQSYMEQRNNQVCVGDSLSQRQLVTSGVPRGSVLGARLFTMYTYHFNILTSEYVKILGVTFDNRMTLQKHITNICWSVNIHIRKINIIRRYLSDTAVRTLVQSIFIARLEYCNSVCIGLPMNRLHGLQLVQNSAARVISQTKRYTSVTPILNELHWLPINKLCQFKIVLLTFKSLNGCAPEYLCDMLNVFMPNRSLRSTAFTSLVPYRNRSIRLGKRLVGNSAAKLWNELPRNIQRADSITMF